MSFGEVRVVGGLDGEEACVPGASPLEERMSQQRLVIGILRVLANAALIAGLMLWLGLCVYGLTAVFQGEGAYSGSRVMLIVAGDICYAVTIVAICISLGLLWQRGRASRLVCALLITVALGQAAVLAYATYLAHIVRSGQTWMNSLWRRLLSDLGLAQLFAYHDWVAILGFATAIAIVATATVILLGAKRARP